MNVLIVNDKKAMNVIIANDKRAMNVISLTWESSLFVADAAI